MQKCKRFAIRYQFKLAYEAAPSVILFLSPLNFEMPCLAIADNPSNPSWKACITIIVSFTQYATFESIFIRADFAWDNNIQ